LLTLEGQTVGGCGDWFGHTAVFNIIL